ncbi:MAG: hypothetical protein Q7W45_01020 [Bacteroidota bacterium]|jgi:hypothetical protein|nr:hypothetical protein [Bacteroidota bacterium]MDP3146680.1 hypothetical protein [Bacteroidota bacterium]
MNNNNHNRKPAIVPYKHEQANKSEGLSLKEKIGLTLLSIAGLGGLIWWGTTAIKNKVEDKAHAKSFDDGNPETLAKQIKMAFENDGYWGTDMEKLRATIISIESKEQLNKVFKAYKKEYHRNMYLDMSDELQASQYNELLQIIATKPEKKGAKPTQSFYTAWAKRLKAAFDKTYSFIPGTDEPAIKAVFAEIPTQLDFVKTGMEYKRMYATDLMEALKSELEYWEIGDYLKIILSKPKK